MYPRIRFKSRPSKNASAHATLVEGPQEKSSMSTIPLPVLSSPFDPALHLHSQEAEHCGPEPPECDYSDDLEALNLQAAESIEKKNERGIVIQHRAWRLPDVFWSDDDYHIGRCPVPESPCLKRSTASPICSIIRKSGIEAPSQTSSPTRTEMPFISSPVSYPPSSSPPTIPEARKRKGPNGRAPPSKKRLLNFDNDDFKAANDHSEGVSTSSSDKVFLAKLQPGTIPMKRGPFVEEDEDDDTHEDTSMLSMFQSVIGQAPGLPNPDLLPVQAESDPQESYSRKPLQARTSSGRAFSIRKKASQASTPYEQLIAGRSTTAPGKATRSYYGLDIHDMLDEAAKVIGQNSKDRKGTVEVLRSSYEQPKLNQANRKGRTMMWTEKYRARKFTDLVGDERIHRDVLRWVKGWDPIVFPGTNRPKPKSKFQDGAVEDHPHRKILLLTGPPGLGKTTLAHVCARQAGYEVVEINASDERSKDVVKGRIRDIVGTENVKGINTKGDTGTVRKAGRPVCVVVDEVDGVVTGSGAGGEGGFIKALTDLVSLDQKNTAALGSTSGNISSGKKSKRADRFRLLRPIILICNDIYHPSLRPLRSSAMTEIIHIRRPPLDKVVSRLKTVFDKEGVACDSDGVRRLCEAAWGIGNKRDSPPNSSNTGEGDIRGVLVIGEWVASKMRAKAMASSSKQARLTKHWVEQNMLETLSHGGGGARGLGRGGAKEAVERIFFEGAGFPKATGVATEDFCGVGNGKTLGVTEKGKRHAMERLREIVDTCGDTDRIMTDCFASYPSQPFQDDTLLSKPNAAYDWLYFHDCLSSKVYTEQEWELSSYLSQPILSFHYLFASPNKHSWSGNQKAWDDNAEESIPFSGPRADYMAFEVRKQNKSVLSSLQSSLSIPLLRSFGSPEDIASGLVPYLNKMLTPNVKPVVVGGSGEQRGVVSVRNQGEREMIERAVGVMSGVGVTFERGRVDAGPSGVSAFVYRMEPAFDELATFETMSSGGQATAPARYAIRQALDQEYQKFIIRQRADAALSRFKAGIFPGQDDGASNAASESAVAAAEAKGSRAITTRRDFFGRTIDDAQPQSNLRSGQKSSQSSKGNDDEKKVWVSFHEGFSNAVRKPITLEELIRGV